MPQPVISAMEVAPALCPVKSVNGFEVFLPRLMDKAEPVFQGFEMVKRIHGRPVDRMGPLASAEDQQREMRISFRRVLPLMEKNRTDRVSGNPGAIGRKPSCGFRKGYEDAARKAAENPVGQARERILFGNRRWDAHEMSSEDHRSRGITTHTNDHGGLKRAEDAERRHQAAGYFQKRRQHPDRTPSFQPLHLQRPEGEPQTAQDFFFQSPFRSDKQNSISRMTP